MSPDQFNGLFELLGALAILNHCRCALRDRQVRGVSLSSTLFFTAWGVWNVWYYPSLGQWWSFVGGMCVLGANALWLGMIVGSRKRRRFA